MISASISTDRFYFERTLTNAECWKWIFRMKIKIDIAAEALALSSDDRLIMWFTGNECRQMWRHSEGKRHTYSRFSHASIYFIQWFLYEKQRLHSRELRFMISFNRFEYSQLSVKRKSNDVILSHFQRISTRNVQYIASTHRSRLCDRF